jgi:hypothetical protein
LHAVGLADHEAGCAAVEERVSQDVVREFFAESLFLLQG